MHGLFLKEVPSGILSGMPRTGLLRATQSGEQLHGKTSLFWPAGGGIFVGHVDGHTGFILPGMQSWTVEPKSGGWRELWLTEHIHAVGIWGWTPPGSEPSKETTTTKGIMDFIQNCPVCN